MKNNNNRIKKHKKLIQVYINQEDNQNKMQKLM